MPNLPSFHAAVLSRPPLFRVRQILFKYTAGDSLTGATFSRASTATYVDVNGIVQTASSGTIRDSNYISGVRSTLLEPQRTNSAFFSEQFDNAVWIATTATVSANAGVAPDGNTTADAITFTNTASGDVEQAAVISGGTASKTITVSVWAKVTSGTLAFKLKNTQGGVLDNFSGTLTATTTWQRFQFTVTNGASAGTGSQIFGIMAAGALGTILLWGAGVEVGAYASAYIATTSAAVTRSADSLQFPGLSTLRGPLTIYSKWNELGAASATGSSMLFLGSDSTNGFQIQGTGTVGYRHWLFASGSGSNSNAATKPTVGQVVEVCATTGMAGSANISQSINGGALDSGAAGTVVGFPASYTNGLWVIHDPLSGIDGGAAIQSIKIAANVQTLAAMQGA